MSQPPIFHDYTFGEQEREKLDRDGHFVLPGVLTPDAQENLTRSLSYIHELSRTPAEGHEPKPIFCRIRQLSRKSDCTSTDA